MIFLIASLGSLIGAAIGIMMATSPEALLNFGAFVGKLMGMPRPEVPVHRTATWSERVVGFGIAWFLLLMTVLEIEAFLRGITAAPANTSENGSWYMLASSVLIFVLGVLLSIRARAAYDWMRRRSGVAGGGQRSHPLGTLIFRIVALVWVVGAIITIWRWMQQSL